MPIDEGIFQTPDGEGLFYRFQDSPSRENALLLIHGHGEHAGRYVKFFSNLRDLGFPIAAFDLRGSGRSSGERVYVNRFKEYLEDVTAFLSFLKSRYEIQEPLQLFGHSLGGLIAAAWANENQEKLSKLILSSPFFGIPMEGVSRWIGLVLDRLAPHFVIHNPVRPSYLTHDLEEVKKYREDPLIQRKITARLTKEMLDYAIAFRTKKYSFSFPLFILMAGDERVVDPKATRLFFQNVESPRKELEALPGFFHEIFNETKQGEAFERLKGYVKTGFD